MSIVADNMNDIKNMDTSPSVFKVFLMACDHLEGFEAWVDFRLDGGENQVNYISCRGNTPEAALASLRGVLEDKFLVKKS
jgi:hypothetical protein